MAFLLTALVLGFRWELEDPGLVVRPKGNIISKPEGGLRVRCTAL